MIRLPEIIKCDNEDACIKINNFILHLININLVPKIKVKKLILYAAKCNSHMVITLVKTLDNFTFINNKIISDYWWLKDLELYNLFLKYYKTKLSHILPLKIYTWDDEDLSYIKPEMLKFIDINKHIALHIIKNNKLVHLIKD